MTKGEREGGENYGVVIPFRKRVTPPDAPTIDAATAASIAAMTENLMGSADDSSAGSQDGSLTQGSIGLFDPYAVARRIYERFKPPAGESEEGREFDPKTPRPQAPPELSVFNDGSVIDLRPAHRNRGPQDP